uniref:Uncharacterized protein n=1 Tax=Arundo donax TaxID=35708 RepID=A0A0A9ADL9_ARUDO
MDKEKEGSHCSTAIFSVLATKAVCYLWCGS